jgi:transposase
VVTKRLGALPVVAEFLRRLDVAGTIDELCPIREIAAVSVGQVVEVLVANRLTSPTPLVRVHDWARTWAVDEVFGIDPKLLNDDRLGRALDEMAPHVEKIVGTIGAKAISEFGIDVSQLHWDMTSMSMHGAYPDDGQDPQFPQVKYGHPKDRRVDLKQVQAGLGVSGDGGIPVLSRVFDGGAAEVSQVVEAIQQMQAIAGAQRFLMVADSKLVSYDNLTALTKAEVEFIAPLPAAKTPPEVFARLDPDTAEVVQYVTARAADRPTEPRAVYRVLEDEYVVAGKRKSDPPLTVRRILVHSQANATAQGQARDKRLAKARQELDKLTAGAGGRYYKTREKIAARVGVIADKRRVGYCLHTEITERPDGTPALAWSFDQQVLAVEAKADGWYALVSNQDPDRADAAAILLRYKRQPGVERRYSDFKGPLAVAPMFLHSNKRITALVHVITLALLVYCLIERQVRRALGGDERMAGLYPDNRRERPTGRMILFHLSEMNINIGTASDPPVIVITRGLQIQLLDLLGIELAHPG